MTTNHEERNKVTSEPRWYRLAKMKYGDNTILEIANFPNMERSLSQNANFVGWFTERIEW